jgi:lysophospholipase L1-like esterase
MKTPRTKSLIGSAALAVVSLAGLAYAPAQDVDRPVEDAKRFGLQKIAHPSLPTLHLIGDSTMKVGAKDQRGWGEEMAPFFDTTKINVVNQAIGGRSSRTFQTEGRWDAALALVKKGDFVVIEFGHNDPGPLNEPPPVTKATRCRGTIKGVGEETQEIDNTLTQKHEVVHTFGWYMRKYAADVKAKGATPVIMSLTPRNSFDNGKVRRAAPNGYGEWAQQAAKATGAIFVDHNDIIAREMEKLGPEKAAPLFADGRLHTTPEGAQLNARCAVAGLKGIPGNPLGRWFSAAARDVEPFPAQK